MSDKTGLASSARANNASAIDVSELAASLGEARRDLLNEVKLRRDVLKPLEQALRALKDPHGNAVALYEASVLLEKPPEDLTLPKSYASLVAELRKLADAQLSDLEFTFARDLRACLQGKGY